MLRAFRTNAKHSHIFPWRWQKLRERSRFSPWWCFQPNQRLLPLLVKSIDRGISHEALRSISLHSYGCYLTLALYELFLMAGPEHSAEYGPANVRPVLESRTVLQGSVAPSQRAECEMQARGVPCALLWQVAGSTASKLPSRLPSRRCCFWLMG